MSIQEIRDQGRENSAEHAIQSSDPLPPRKHELDLEKLKELRKPFPAESVSILEKKEKGSGKVLARLNYVGHAAVTDRLLNVDPAFNWEPMALDKDGLPVVRITGSTAELWARFTLLGKTILAVGTCQAGKGDQSKELIGDMLRNGAMRFGVALDLWCKNELESRLAEPEPDFSALISGLRDLGVTDAHIINRMGKPIAALQSTEDYDTLLLMGKQVEAGRTVDQVFGKTTVPNINRVRAGKPPAQPRASVETSPQPNQA